MLQIKSWYLKKSQEEADLIEKEWKGYEERYKSKVRAHHELLWQKSERTANTWCLELKASAKHTHTGKHRMQVKEDPWRLLHKLIPDTHPQTSPSFKHPHIGRIRKTFSWVCEAAPHTHKESLGDRISGLTADSHMSSSSNWYSKLYTFKCHQERAKPSGAFLCTGSTVTRRGLFCWTNTLVFTVLAAEQTESSRYEVQTGRMERQMDVWKVAEEAICEGELRLVLLLVACSSTPPPQNSSGVDPSGWRGTLSSSKDKKTASLVCPPNNGTLLKASLHEIKPIYLKWYKDCNPMGVL